MQASAFILQLLAFAVAAATTLLIEHLSRRRGLLPPGFARPARRWLANAVLASTFYLAVFGPMAGILGGEPGQPAELTEVDTPWLFALHALMAIVLLIWYGLGFVGVRRDARRDARPAFEAEPGSWPAHAGVESPPPPPPSSRPEPSLEPGAQSPSMEVAPEPVSARAFEPPMEDSLAAEPSESEQPAEPDEPAWLRFARQLGLVTHRPLEDIAIGLLGGVACWVGMVVVMMTVVGIFVALGGEDSLPQSPPQAVSFMVALPWLVRLALSLSAGFFEEIFFRGFLQGRAGILLSSLLFVLAHASYEQPFMLVGLTFLSLLLGYIVVWRQNIWPAIIAHAAFDAVQLLVVIPMVMEMGVGGASSGG